MRIANCNLKIANYVLRNLEPFTTIAKKPLKSFSDIVSTPLLSCNNNVSYEYPKNDTVFECFLSCYPVISRYLADSKLSCNGLKPPKSFENNANQIVPIRPGSSKKSDLKLGNTPISVRNLKKKIWTNRLNDADIIKLPCRTKIKPNLITDDFSLNAVAYGRDNIPGNRNAIEDEKATKSALTLRPYILGIDPGITGAMAIIAPSNGTITLIDVFDIPVWKDKKGRNRIDIFSLALKVDSYSTLLQVALIEEVGFQTGVESAHSQFVFGFASGAVHGVLHTCLIPVQSVKPSVWKASFGLSKDKDASIQKAIKLIPESAKYLTRKKDHGRAEAILLAYFASKHLKAAA